MRVPKREFLVGFCEFGSSQAKIMSVSSSFIGIVLVEHLFLRKQTNKSKSKIFFSIFFAIMYFSGLHCQFLYILASWSASCEL